MRARADLRAVRCVGVALTAIALLGSGQALAASIGTITYDATFSMPPFGRSVKPDEINFFDCVASRKLSYDVATTGASGSGLVLDVLVAAPGATAGCTVNQNV